MAAVTEPTTTSTTTNEEAEPASAEVVVELMKALGHPIRVGVLRELRRGEKSPGEMATALGLPLGVVSYHVRMLRDYGAVELTRTEPRRGALQHFYAARKEVREMLKAFDRVAKATGKAQAEREA